MSQSHVQTFAPAMPQVNEPQERTLQTSSSGPIPSVAHSSMRNPDDDQVSDDIMAFDGIPPVSRSQDISCSLAQSNTFGTEPLTHGVTDGGLDTLLPETREILHIPLSASVGIDNGGRSLDRPLLGSSVEANPTVQMSNRPNTGGFLSSEGIIVGASGIANFSMHVPRSPVCAYNASNAGVGLSLHGSASDCYSLPIVKDNPLEGGMVAEEVAEPMLMLGRNIAHGSSGNMTPCNEENGLMIRGYAAEAATSAMRIEREDGATVAGVPSGERCVSQQGPRFGLESPQMETTSRNKPKAECAEMSSQDAQSSPSSPVYSAVTISPPAAVQTCHGVSETVALVGAGQNNAVSTTLSDTAGRACDGNVRHANGMGDGSLNVTDDGAEIGVIANRRVTGTSISGGTGGAATVTQSNLSGGNNGLSSCVKAPVGSALGLVCPICGTQFTRRYNLKVHMSSKHSARRDYHCKQCPNAFNRGDSLKRHIATTHRGEKKWRCPYCQRDFGQRPHMKMHIDTVHLKKRDHKCHCGKAFGTRYNLSAHQRTHQQTPKKHLCIVCNKSFALKSSLARHQRNSGHGVCLDTIEDKCS